MQPRFPASYMNIPTLYMQEQIELKALESLVSMLDLEGGPEIEI